MVHHGSIQPGRHTNHTVALRLKPPPTTPTIFKVIVDSILELQIALPAALQVLSLILRQLVCTFSSSIKKIPHRKGFLSEKKDRSPRPGLHWPPSPRMGEEVSPG